MKKVTNIFNTLYQSCKVMKKSKKSTKNNKNQYKWEEIKFSSGKDGKNWRKTM